MSREMKNSGVDWVGDIPKEWATQRFKFAGTLQKGKLPSSTNVDKIGLPIIGASEMLGKEARQFSQELGLPTCNPEDILILWDGANAGITETNLTGIVSSTASCFTCKDKKCYHKFVGYLFKVAELYFRDKVFGTTIPHMSTKFIDDFPMLVPPIPEQKAIADFLDKKCGEIDELIALQEKIIEELKAYKQSVITEAVTKGLDSDVPMKDSGIEWIGEIPYDWQINRIKTIYQERTELSETGEENLLSVSEYYGVDKRAEKVGENEFISRSDSLVGYKKCYKGDLVSNIMLAWKGSLGTSPYEGIVSPAYCVYKPSNNIFPKYYHYLFRTSLYTGRFRCFSKGIIDSRLRLYSPYFYDIEAIIPSLPEQIAIADFLDKKCSEIDSLISIKTSKIESLKEYKKSIIYEYVTGKKEIL